MAVAAAEFKGNGGRYLENVREGDVPITRCGRHGARFETPSDPHLELPDEPMGRLDPSMAIEDAEADRAASP